MDDPYHLPDTPRCAAPVAGGRFYTSDRLEEHAPEIAAAGIVMDELAADLPQVFYDAGYEVSTGPRDAVGLDEAPSDRVYDRDSLVTAYAVKGLLGDVDIAPRNFQVRSDGTIYPIDVELAGYTTVADMDAHVCDGESMFETSISEVAADIGVETEGIEQAYAETVRELADGVDIRRLDARLADDPYVDRYGPEPEHVAMRRDRQIYQNVIDARTDDPSCGGTFFSTS